MTTPRLKQEVSQFEDVYYPIDDDEPLAESEHQLFPLTYAHSALRSWFEDDPTTWVGADMFLYYEEGVPSSVVAPDVFVVTQTHKRHLRNIFRTWVEGRVPELVLEVMSRTSVRRDTVTKYELYERLGVREYWLYDPTEDGVLRPRLRGYILAEGEYSSIEVREVDGKYVSTSEVLGLEFHANAEWFRFFDPVAGEYLPDNQENQHARLEANARAGEANARAGEANARAGEANARAGEANARAEEANARAGAAEAREAALEAELRRLRG